MSSEQPSPEEVAKQAMERDGYDQIALTERTDVPVVGKPEETASWWFWGTARHKRSGKRYRTSVHVKRNFGSLYGDATQQGREII
jgi:hypothetical protein